MMFENYAIVFYTMFMFHTLSCDPFWDTRRPSVRLIAKAFGSQGQPQIELNKIIAITTLSLSRSARFAHYPNKSLSSMLIKITRLKDSSIIYADTDLRFKPLTVIVFLERRFT